MTHLYIAFIIMLLYFFSNVRNKGFLCVSSFLIFVYTFSMGCGVLYNTLYDVTLINKDVYVFPIYYVLAAWLLLLSPFYIYNETKITSLRLPKIRTLNVISDILIVFSLISFIVFIPNVKNAFSVESIALARNDLVAGNESSGSGFFYTVSAVTASFYVIPLILSFIYSIIGGNRIRMFLLFISSFSYPLYNFNCLGRDGVVFWLLSFFACFIFFKDFMSDRSKHIIKRAGFFFIILLLVPFFIISQSRFGDEINRFLLSYAGESFTNAAYYFGAPHQPVNYGQGFPLFLRLLGMNEVEGLVWEVEGTDSTAFGSLIKSYGVALGNFGMWLLEIISLFLFLRLLGKNRRFDFSNFFIYFLYFQVISEGLFYFKHSNIGGNFYILMSFVLFFFFRIYLRSHSKTQIVINKPAYK